MRSLASPERNARGRLGATHRDDVCVSVAVIHRIVRARAPWWDSCVDEHRAARCLPKGHRLEDPPAPGDSARGSRHDEGDGSTTAGACAAWRGSRAGEVRATRRAPAAMAADSADAVPCVLASTDAVHAGGRDGGPPCSRAAPAPSSTAHRRWSRRVSSITKSTHIRVSVPGAPAATRDRRSTSARPDGGDVTTSSTSRHATVEAGRGCVRARCGRGPIGRRRWCVTMTVQQGLTTVDELAVEMLRSGETRRRRFLHGSC